MPDVVISIKSRFVDMILEGKKTYELRKRYLPASNGIRFFIYSSGRDKKIVGHCSLCYDPLEYSFGDHYPFHDFLSSHVCISWDEYCDYIGHGEGEFYYQIREVVAYSEPLDLSHFGLTHAPQSWAYAKCIPANLMDGDI